jgi:CHASE2 domain-containing sensor protein
METWSPLTLYACAFAAAAAGGIAVYLRSDKPVKPRLLFAEAVYHGLMGAGLGAVAYEWKWRSKPGTVIAIAAFYGLGLFTLGEIKEALLRALNFSQQRTKDDPDKP